MKFSILVCRPIKGIWINFWGRGGGSPQIPIHYCMHPNAATWTGILRATVKAGTQERGTECGTEIRCKVRQK